MLDVTAFLVSVFLILLSVLLLRTVINDYIRVHTRRAVRREAQRVQARGIWLPVEQVESLQVRLRHNEQPDRQQGRQPDNSGVQGDHHAVTAAARR